MAIYMKAPKGTTSANIMGHTYEKIGKDGVVEVLSDTHIDTLARHGFEPHFIDDKVGLAAQIEAMTDKDQLVEFIEERGGVADTEFGIKKLKRLAREAAEIEE